MAKKKRRPSRPRKRKAESVAQYKERIAAWRVKLAEHEARLAEAEFAESATSAPIQELSDAATDAEKDIELMTQNNTALAEEAPVVAASVSATATDTIDIVFREASAEVRGEIVRQLSERGIYSGDDIASTHINEIQSILSDAFFSEANRVVDSQLAGGIDPAIESALQNDAEVHGYDYNSMFGRRARRTLGKTLRRLAGNKGYKQIVQQVKQGE